MHNGDKLNLHSNHGKRSEESPGSAYSGTNKIRFVHSV